MAADHLASGGTKAPITYLPCREFTLRAFQQRVTDCEGSLMLEAPTGSGKTRAAISWALANRKCGERIFYVLPYQASINSMANTLMNDKDYNFGKDSVGIIHHNALLQEFRQYIDDENDCYEEAYNTAKTRMDQTRQFYRPIKIITPYQILKLLFGCKRFELGLAEMLGSIVIFDEIHAYDAHVSALIETAIKFLKPLKIRYLLMSATFPEFLKRRLSEAIGSNNCITLEGIDESEKQILSIARHRLKIHDDYLENMDDEIINSSKNGTVLVVCNRIEQAKNIYNKLKNRCDSISLIHGGFTQKDRYTKEQKLFKSSSSMEPSSRILVSTQVIEVSLNISFDTIYTEIAPVDDLLQRFGRVNRIYEHKRPVDVHVAKKYNEEKVKFIYNIERLDLTLKCAPNNLELTPLVEREWIKAVYANGYITEEEEKYNLAKDSFTRVINSLKPMISGDDTEFNNLFNSINVIPAGLVDEYDLLFKQSQFLNASQLLMSISYSSYHKYNAEGCIECIVIGNENQTEKLIVIKRKYDSDIGLLDEPEAIPTTMQQL